MPCPPSGAKAALMPHLSRPPNILVGGWLYGAPGAYPEVPLLAVSPSLGVMGSSAPEMQGFLKMFKTENQQVLAGSALICLAGTVFYGIFNASG